MPPLISAPKGVYDVVGDDSARFDAVESAFFAFAARFGYRNVRLPIFEATPLFVRSVGEATDIVRKEMFSFARGEDSFTLRPEGTAGAVRCFVEHHLDQAGLPWKAAYGGPMFRAEQPQRGRNRQFFQLGVEAIGIDDPELDVEVIELAWGFLRSLGLSRMTLKLNTIGQPSERGVYIERLRDWALATVPDMGDEDRERLERNPLRVLDSKDPGMLAVLDAAPRLADSLGAASTERFAAVRAGLDAAQIPYVVDDRLVRGLDYYTATTFEIASASIDAAQNALGGGGHYDGLVAELGGPELPGIGFALGVERILLACEAESVLTEAAPLAEVCVVAAGSEVAVEVAALVRDLRAAGIATERPLGGRSLKAQFKHADRVGARWTVIVGARDLADGVVTVRDMTGGDEVRVPPAEVIEVIRR